MRLPHGLRKRQAILGQRDGLVRLGADDDIISLHARALAAGESSRAIVARWRKVRPFVLHESKRFPEPALEFVADDGASDAP
jgi:hypothetical protein